ERQYNATYQFTMFSPTSEATSAPSARNVPYGSAYFIPPFRNAITARPMSDPAIDESTSVTSTSFQPRNAPIIASILTSPPPMPSWPEQRNTTFQTPTKT